MNIEKDTYFDLNRRFSAIPVVDDKVDPFSHRNFRGNATTVSWDDLLEKKRVVILAEAGAGKTEEMSAACRSIRKAGGRSFFIRLEHLVAVFDCSFDEGNVTEFDEWLQSQDEAWIFLDSVDEARLQGPQDFERAIRVFAAKIESAKTRSHIYISARESEWRPHADLKLVENKLGLPADDNVTTSDTELESSQDELFELVVSRFEDLKVNFEDGDDSIASILIKAKKETEIRNFIGNWLRERAHGKYSVPQEEEMADAKKPDIRIHVAALDAPVPIELKIADKWSGPPLFERLENQLIGDYLGDRRSSCGMFVLVFRGEKSYWETDRCPDKELSFECLVQELQTRADELLNESNEAEQVRVIGIDLTLRHKKSTKKKSTKKKKKPPRKKT